MLKFEKNNVFESVHVSIKNKRNVLSLFAVKSLLEKTVRRKEGIVVSKLADELCRRVVSLDIMYANDTASPGGEMDNKSTVPSEL